MATGINGGNGGVALHDQSSYARSYQIEALEQAMKQNTIVFLETGAGKTLIAIMLLRRYAHLLKKPSPFIAVFLVPTVVLVKQQADAVRKHLDLVVGEYWGDKGVDFWNAAEWRKEQDENQLLVMTPKILENALSHKFLSMDTIKVLIFDECHNARKKHAYAVIMTDYYHRQLQNGVSQLPRILGMTASPVKAKESSSSEDYWKQIKTLETLLNSKVYTCASESVLAEYIPFSTAKYRFYADVKIPDHTIEALNGHLAKLREKYEITIRNSNLSESSLENASKRLSKLSSTFAYCISELGIWLASKAAEAYSCEANDNFTWGPLDLRGETIVREFCKEAKTILTHFIPAGWAVNHHINEGSVRVGILSSKVMCLVESLVDYRHMDDMRCIVFVERVITAIVLKLLLRELNPRLFRWNTEYTAGNNSTMQSQSRNVQNKIVDEFRQGKVNIIVATSILEEGLDVQSCNLVIRFDLSSTVCSFIQSRGRARMRNSDFLLLIRSGDNETLERVNNYLMSGKIMRDESLRHASEPCEPLDSDVFNEPVYYVESTGASLSLSSSISMVYFYCSRLPSDGYFKPYPRFVIDKELGTCTIFFPKSSPLPIVHVSGTVKYLKQLACLEACKLLHKMGALTDNLVPDTVEKAVDSKEIEFDYEEEHVQFVPPQLVGRSRDEQTNMYHFYCIKLKNNFEHDIPLQDIVLGVKTNLELDNKGLSFSLEADRGRTDVSIMYIGTATLTPEQVNLAHQYQMTVLRVLLDHSITKLLKSIEVFKSKSDHVVFDYLLFPSMGMSKNQMIIDWKSVCSVSFPFEKQQNCSVTNNYHQKLHTRNGLVCSCLIENSLVFTPHNERVYCTTKRLFGLNGNSLLQIKEGESVTYKSYYKTRHGIDLKFEEESFFAARQLFVVRNFLQRGRHYKEKETSNAGVELPSELCFILMSPISISTFYSFSFVPSIMHRIESWLIALNLKKMLMDCSQSNGNVPVSKVLEAITTKKCQESFHLESFETLGDSFLKYAATQQLFKTLQDQHEGILSSWREKIICNDSLCKLGCNCNLPGFIRNEPFDPKTFVVPGDRSVSSQLEEKRLSDKRTIYIGKKRNIKKKVVADAVEALIGVFLSEGGELAALSFMSWLGIKVDFVHTPYERSLTLQPEKFLDIRHLESLLNYSFRDASLLVEALTHGSYMLPEIPKCYQRLEFLGDAVLDYLITVHLYNKNPGITPGMLTDLRSGSVNNDCFAHSAVKFQLYKHILHRSQDLHRHITSTVHDFAPMSLQFTFGWESETSFPKVLGDIIESLAGAILVDSGFNKAQVFESIRPLLEPLVTPETIKLHPVKELHDMCQKNHYEIKKSANRNHDGTISFTVEVNTENGLFKESYNTTQDNKMAERIASKRVLESIKVKMASSKIALLHV